MVHGDDDFPFGAPFSKIPERFRNLAQRIPSINDRDDFAGFTELRHVDQIFEIWLNRQDAYVLARGSSNPWSQEQNLEECRYGTSDKEVTPVGP